MANLYDEIMSFGGLGKLASAKNEDQVSAVKLALEECSDEELVRLANELSGLASGGMGDLEAMTLQSPSYLEAPGNAIQSEEQLEALEDGDPTTGGDPDVNEANAPVDQPFGQDAIVDGIGGEGDATDGLHTRASEHELGKEVLAEADRMGITKTATETLLDILKEGAALEQLIETRAYEYAEAMFKEAEDLDMARAIIDQAVAGAGIAGTEAHEVSCKAMEHAKTEAAKANIPVAQAAHAIAGNVIAIGKVASADEDIDDAQALVTLASYASQIEAEYEKIAEASVAAAQNVLIAAGQGQGLSDSHLYEFVAKGMEQVKTHSAQTGKSIPETALDVVSGAASAGVTAAPGYDGGIAPSQAVAGIQVKAPINSNITQSPEKMFAQMTGDPQAVAEDVVMTAPAIAAPIKTAQEELKDIIKEAMLARIATQ